MKFRAKKTWIYLKELNLYEVIHFSFDKINTMNKNEYKPNKEASNI